MRIYRRDVRPFTEKQIALVTELCRPGRHRHREHAAAQRIAQRTTISRLLEQQTATSEVLSVIIKSPGELEPVFQAMLENAVRICGANSATSIVGSATLCDLLATHNTPPAFAENAAEFNPYRPGPDTPTGRMVAHKGGHSRRRSGGGPRFTEQDDRGDGFGVGVAGIGRCSSGADAQGRRTDRRHHHLPPGGSALHREADRASYRISRPRP